MIDVTTDSFYCPFVEYPESGRAKWFHGGRESDPLWSAMSPLCEEYLDLLDCRPMHRNRVPINDTSAPSTQVGEVLSVLQHNHLFSLQILQRDRSVYGKVCGFGVVRLIGGMIRHR